MIARRGLFQLGLTGVASLLSTKVHGQRFVPERPLKPGEFVWEPERSPSGPVVLIVSIPEQLAHVYRNGVEIGRSTCSTGKPGHRTPTGVFTILEKQRQHVSSIYKGAQMPNMERLTWGGIALHAGHLPGYPASHGCIRLPMKFSALLFEVTHNGTAVIIADERTQPANVVHPGVLMPKVAEIEARAVSQAVAQKKPRGPWDAEITYPSASVVISRADGMAHISRDGKLQASYLVSFVEPARPLGTHIYSLIGPAADGSGLAFLSFGMGKKPSEAHIVQWQGDKAMRRVRFYDPQRARQIAQTFHPGTTIVLTDATAPRTTRNTPNGFSVIASEVAG